MNKQKSIISTSAQSIMHEKSQYWSNIWLIFVSWNDAIYRLSILVVIFQTYILQLTDMFTCYKYICSYGCESCLSLIVWHMFDIGDSLANITICKLLVSDNMAKLSGQQYSPPHISADKSNQWYSPLAWKLPGTVCMSSSWLVYVRATSQETVFYIPWIHKISVDEAQCS